jgi:hypothetical protein
MSGQLVAGPPTSHAVKFRWRSPELGDPQVVEDSLAPGLYSVLARNTSFWPTALGHVFAPEVPGAGTDIIRSKGSGCLTMAGLPVPGVPDPGGLLVDLRDATNPIVTELNSAAELVAACP